VQREISPAASALAIVATLSILGLILWRYADSRRPPHAVPARLLLRDRLLQAPVMERYRDDFGQVRRGAPGKPGPSGEIRRADGTAVAPSPFGPARLRSERNQIVSPRRNDP
jgi:hypothetical protein